MNRFVIIILAFFVFAHLFAHSISVSSFKLLDTDLTANTAGTMEQDQNGETAALIKVVTTQTGFTFDGGSLGIVKTIQKPSEIWVYVPRGLKKITISHPQLGILRDYYLNIPIEAARTYEMILVTGEVQTTIKQPRISQYVVFQLSPADAVVELDGELLKTEGGVASKMMKFGTYNYRVQAPDYLLEAGSVTIDDPENKKIVNISLKPNFVQVNIEVEDNAEIWVNGEKMGTGTWSGNLGAGIYEIEAKKEGHRKTSTTREFVVSSKPQVIKLQSPTPVYGETDINSSPGMADIYIDGIKVGQTPQLISKILIGKHELTIKKEGYETKNDSIEIFEGVVSEYNTNLNTNQSISQSNNNSLGALEVENITNESNRKVFQLINAGKESFRNKDYKKAQKFAQKADAVAKHQSSEAFVLLGDIEAYNGTDAKKAAMYYDKAILLAPNNSDAYKKWAMLYRKINLDKAVNRLREMGRYCPDEDVHAIVAHLYMLEDYEQLAYENYAKADINKLNISGLNEFVRSSYFTGHFEDALRAAEAGIKLEPRNPIFNRLAMYSSYELNMNDKAYYYLNRYFNETDNVTFTEYDYFYSGHIYETLSNYKSAIEEYKKAMRLVTPDSMIKKEGIQKKIDELSLK